MTLDQISQAKDKDLPASLIAIRRAAYSARVIAVQTETAIIVMRDQKLIRISADELREAGVTGNPVEFVKQTANDWN